MTKFLSKITTLALVLIIGPMSAQARRCQAQDYCSADGKLSARYEKIVRASIPLVVTTYGKTIFNKKATCADVDTSAAQSMSNCKMIRYNASNLFLGEAFFRAFYQVAPKVTGQNLSCSVNPHKVTDAILGVYDSKVYATFDIYTGQQREFTYGEFANLMVAYLGAELCH